MDFTDRTVVITGAASGIGKATARRFVQEGANVVVADIDVEAAEAFVDNLSGRAIAVEADVSDPATVDALMETTVENFGPIDVLVNNAAIDPDIRQTVDSDVDRFSKIIDVNMKGPFYCMKYALRSMINQEQGSIVNVSSAASLGGLPYRTAYAPSKRALNYMTKVLACELGEYGIRVNAIAPGTVRTPLIERLIENGKLEHEARLNRTPLGRLAEPMEIADSILYLASNRASYMTGSLMVVDGGWGAFGGYYEGVHDLV